MTQEDTRQALAQLLSDIGEDCYCASWMDGVEHQVWEALQTDAARRHSYGMDHIEPEQLAEAARMSADIGGWVYWHVTKEGSPEEQYLGTGPRFIEMSEWLKKHAGWKASGGKLEEPW